MFTPSSIICFKLTYINRKLYYQKQNRMYYNEQPLSTKYCHFELLGGT